MFSRLVILLMITFSINANALDYKVTNGSVSVTKIVTETKMFNVNSSTSRIDFNTTGERLKLNSTYLGPSSIKTPLASGAIVEQYGIKLRSVNTCNLVYVIRMFYPKPLISVSYKQNIGQSTHEQCGAKGYTVIKNIPMEPISIGSTVVLEAFFEANNVLTVKENNIQVWKGTVNFNQVGISGFRSDNVKVKFNVQ